MGASCCWLGSELTSGVVRRRSLVHLQKVYCGGGSATHMLLLSGEELVRVTGGVVADVGGGGARVDTTQPASAAAGTPVSKPAAGAGQASSSPSVDAGSAGESKPARGSLNAAPPAVWWDDGPVAALPLRFVVDASLVGHRKCRRPRHTLIVLTVVCLWSSEGSDAGFG